MHELPCFTIYEQDRRNSFFSTDLLDMKESFKDKKIEQIFEWKQSIPAVLVGDFVLQVA